LLMDPPAEGGKKTIKKKIKRGPHVCYRVREKKGKGRSPRIEEEKVEDERKKGEH